MNNTTLTLERYEWCYFLLLLTYKILEEKIPFVCKVTSSLSKRVSWLKFEPWSRILPIKIQKFWIFINATKKIFSS